MRNTKEIPETRKKVIQVNERIAKEQLSEIIRETLEETPNKEAVQLFVAQKNDKAPKPEITSGKVILKVLRLQSGKQPEKIHAYHQSCDSRSPDETARCCKTENWSMLK